MVDDESPTDETEDRAQGDELPIVHVSDLFGDRREIYLELDGVLYRLRITRRNKLILQK